MTILNRPGSLVQSTDGVGVGVRESDKRIRDYNENHDPQTGEFSEGSGGGGVEKSVLAAKVKQGGASSPTPSEHVGALRTATSKAQLRGEFAAIRGNTQLKLEHFASIAKKYTGAEPSSKTKEGILKEIGAHWQSQNSWRSK